MNSVVTDNIIKNYGDTKALKGVSFDVGKGEIFGIIGPDGAGKTTLFRILTTLLEADGGTASVEGFDVIKDYKQIRNIVGYMPGHFSLYSDLTVEENLDFFASVFGTNVKDNYYIIRDIYIQLEPFKNRLTEQLSGGMKQKLALCCALVHKPLVLFLDEPTTGVDPVSRQEFWQILKGLKKEGIAIIASTPYMDEAAMCDRIALIQEGKFLTIDTPDNIIAQYDRPLFSVKTEKRMGMLNELRQIPETTLCYAYGESFHVNLKKDLVHFDLSAQLRKMGYDDVVVEPIKPSVEDCFMALNNN